MSHLTKIAAVLGIRHAPPQRTRKRLRCGKRPHSFSRYWLRMEALESRVTPSINPATPFELDGNATTQTTHDWDQIFADAGSPAIHTSGSFTKGPTSLALAGTFLSDESTGDDIYTGGSTKDTLPISGWMFKTGAPQDKDEITDAYATAYTDPNNGHLLLYAGLDRFVNSGDATAGFWFFQNKISKSTNANVGGSGAPFTGVHADGDILLVSDFTIGGSASTIRVFRWTGTDANGSLVPLNNGNPINGDTFATVNSGPISVPWSYTDKGGSTQPQAGEFLEEGVDLTDLGIQGCFSSFLAETRSSQSPTATLSDFVLGGFPLCSLAATPFNSLSKFDTFTNQGDTVTYQLTVQNTGGMSLFIQSVTDTLLGNIVVNHTLQQPVAPVTSITSAFNFSQPLAPGASLTILVTRPVQSGDPDPTTDTVTFVGTDDLAGTEDPISTSVVNSVNLFQPSAAMTEVASPTAGVVGTPITYTYTVTNTSSSDSPNLVLNSANQGTGDPDSFTSSLFGDIEADAVHALAGNNTATTASLAPGASFSFTETHVLAASDPTPLTDTSNVIFTLAQNLGAFPNRIHSNATTATVRIVNAEISIAPNGVNEVNHPHTFTVTVLEDLGDGNGFVAAANEPVTVTLTNTNGSTTSPTTFNVTTDATGHASVTFTSATAGTVIGNASTTFTIEGVTLTRATGDSNAGDSGPATKIFEDATISIAASGVNEVNNPHTFTVTVLENAGDGNGFVAAANEPVTVTLTNTNGSTTSPTTFNVTTNSSGQASVTFTSATAGTVIGNASTTFTLNGVTLTRATGDSNVGDSGPVTKVFEDANISITGSGVNEVNNPHTFTVTVLENAGDGNGFVAAANEPVTVTLTNTNGSTTSPTTFNVTTDSTGHASVTFTSATAGEVIGNASTTFTLNGVTLTRTTGDLHAGDSGPVTKFFEDANISIAPNATNGITEPHTFTVTVLDNAGDGNGFVAAANEPVTVTLTGQNGAVPIAETPLSGTTNASGQFSVTFTSDSAGQVIGNASTTFTLNGVTLTRATGDSHTGDSGPATKTFVAGKILWKKVDGFGNPLGGATFQVTATGGTAATLSPTSVTVVDNGPFDANPANGLFELDAYQSFGGSNLTGLALGTYTIQETAPPPGFNLDPTVLTVTLTQSSLVADVTGTPFVDLQPNLNIVKTVTANQTVIHPGGTASFTITVSNPNPPGGTAGAATNVVMTDNLPDATMLTWSVTSFSGFTSASVSNSGVLTATDPSLPGGGTASVVVSAPVPLNFFGNPGTGTGNGDVVPLNLFELDGNATTGVLGSSGSTTTSHDWDQVFADNTANPKTNTAAALASSFVSDETTGDDIFTGGSTKDTLPVSGWLFKTGKPQDKDEISHAYAALYKDPSTNDVILYAGLDRFSNSGDSTAGFWFFVNPINKSTSGTVTGSGAPFTGTHHDGDVLLVSDFSVGGSVSTISVFRWTGDDATGHLVNITSFGNPSTFAIVNGAPISVPWSYMDKSGHTQPQAGEFLEEGVNLTGLGLSPCFSSFLAETRSSTSPTATLSDFIIGPNFQTCDVMLPNQASVSASNFNNGQPITSNTVIIDLNDGMPQLADAVGNGAATASLTAAQLQPIVAQAIAAWRAAGADPGALSNVANFTIHIANLPDGELGWELPGQIWIDATAAGWGWSTGSTPVSGRMDLLTVVSHEVGHVLGFGDHTDGNDVMTTALAAGVRRLPEEVGGFGGHLTTTALPVGSSMPVGGAPAGAAASFRTSELGITPALAAIAGPSHADSLDAALTAAAAAFRDTAGAPLGPTGAVLPLGLQTPAPLTTAAAAPTITASRLDRDAASVLVPGLLPPTPRPEPGADAGLSGGSAEDADQPRGLNRDGTSSDTPLGQDTSAGAEHVYPPWAHDACFADELWTLSPAAVEAPLPAAEAAPRFFESAAAVALALAGASGAFRSETERRAPRRLRS